MAKQLSNRAQKLLEERKFGQVDPVEIESGAIAPFDWEIGEGDRLYLSYKVSSERLKNILFESIALMLNGREAQRILALTFKEVENFLRDENTIPAFDSDTQQFMQTLFDEMKIKLLATWLLVQNATPAIDENESFIEKMRFVDKLFLELQSLMGQKEDYQFVFFEYEFIYYSKKAKIKETLIEDALELFLGHTLGKTIKLVAV